MAATIHRTTRRFVHEIEDLRKPLAVLAERGDEGETRLNWLLAHRAPIEVEQDYIACRQARLAVGTQSALNRHDAIRFNHLSKATRSGLDGASNRPIHLNPIREWKRFVSSALLDHETVPPVNVLFFVKSDEIRAAVLALEGQALLNELAECEACTLEQWSAFSALADEVQLRSFVDELITLGLAVEG